MDEVGLGHKLSGLMTQNLRLGLQHLLLDMEAFGVCVCVCLSGLGVGGWVDLILGMKPT